jgi:hypothetical protein
VGPSGRLERDNALLCLSGLRLCNRINPYWVVHLPNMEIPLITYLLSPTLRGISKKKDPRSFFAIPTPPWAEVQELFATVWRPRRRRRLWRQRHGVLQYGKTRSRRETSQLVPDVANSTCCTSLACGHVGCGGSRNSYHWAT